MANLILVKSKTDTVVMNEVPVHPEEAIEKMIFETENILPEVFLLKRQQNTYNNKERIDVIGLDNENNIVIIEIKDEMAHESVLSQVLNYAVWVEAHPDAIKNLQNDTLKKH